ncbi:hypothetical protein Tco_0615893 [Tanacetum coccineum]
MMEQPVLSLIEESLLVVFVELMGFDRNVEELMMVSDLLEPSIVVDEEVLDKTVIVLENLIPTIDDLATDVNDFYRILKEEMVVDLRYFHFLEKEVESLQSKLELQQRQFSNEIDQLLREYYYVDHMNAILGVYTTIDEYSAMSCDYLEALKNEKNVCENSWVKQSLILADTEKALKDKIDSLITELKSKTVESHDLRA